MLRDGNLHCRAARIYAGGKTTIMSFIIHNYQFAVTESGAPQTAEWSLTVLHLSYLIGKGCLQSVSSFRAVRYEFFVRFIIFL